MDVYNELLEIGFVNQNVYAMIILIDIGIQ